MLDAEGQQHLLHLAGVGLVEGQEALARQLLGERAAALGEPPFLEVGDHRAANPHHVDPGVFAEALILDGEHGVDEMGRDVGECHFEPPLVENREGRHVDGVVEDGGLRHLAHTLHVVDARQIGEERVDRPLGAADDGELRRHHGHRHDGADAPEARGQGPQPGSQAARQRTGEQGVDSHGNSLGAAEERMVPRYYYAVPRKQKTP